MDAQLLMQVPDLEQNTGSDVEDGLTHFRSTSRKPLNRPLRCRDPIRVETLQPTSEKAQRDCERLLERPSTRNLIASTTSTWSVDNSYTTSIRIA